MKTPRSAGTTVLALGALGVVFGDIGTSPLYALHTAFSMEHNAVSPTPDNVYGIISMVLWTITLIVTCKYVLLVTRADNQGQGGILALLALLRDRFHNHRRLGAVVGLLGMCGAALFYGDAVITPAISVLSAVEGLSVVSPNLSTWVVPISAVVLALIFALQPMGTGHMGLAFGPIMLLWFLVLVALGVPQIIAHPEILFSLSPHWAVALILNQPFQAFVLLGAVVLTVTGAEALYADMGHFGARPVRLAWFVVVMPALVIIYLGQGALVISHPDTVGNPMFHLAPPALQIPLLILATMATVIASQAVISGAFSLTRQAIHLNLLPRMLIRHTSRSEAGQIYLPLINLLLFFAVMALVFLFPSSEYLANAYGLAVTGTLVLVSIIFLIYAHFTWNWDWWRSSLFFLFIGVPEVFLLAANTTKILAGGWIPLLIAAILILFMLVWQWGSTQVRTRRRLLEGGLDHFLASLDDLGPHRVPGVAVFPHHNPDTVPLALLKCVADLGMLHSHVIIVRLVQRNLPSIPETQRVSVDLLGSASDGIVYVEIQLGYADEQDIPGNLRLALKQSEELDVDLDQATYFLSALTLRPARPHSLRGWRQGLFLSMDRNQATRTETFRLPPARTVVLGTELRI